LVLGGNVGPIGFALAIGPSVRVPQIVSGAGFLDPVSWGFLRIWVVGEGNVAPEIFENLVGATCSTFAFLFVFRLAGAAVGYVGGAQVADWGGQGDNRCGAIDINGPSAPLHVHPILKLVVLQAIALIMWVMLVGDTVAAGKVMGRSVSTLDEPSAVRRVGVVPIDLVGTVVVGHVPVGVPCRLVEGGITADTDKFFHRVLLQRLDRLVM